MGITAPYLFSGPHSPMPPSVPISALLNADPEPGSQRANPLQVDVRHHLLSVEEYVKGFRRGTRPG